MFSALRKPSESPLTAAPYRWKQPDVYMVVGGVPVSIGSHAQIIANFALRMRISAKEVMNPVTGEPIQAESS